MYSKEQQIKISQLTNTIIANKHSDDPANDMKELIEVINFHEWKYYIQNDPIISDYEYDVLFKKLVQLEELRPDLISADSPTNRVSNDITDRTNTVNHLTPMLSLDNSYNEEDLLDFDKQVKKLTSTEGDVIYCIEPKFDGGSIALVYEDDKLLRATTRGNGVIGEEMTNNAKAMRSIPLKADFSKYGIYTVELRGEALIRKDNFDKINKKREEDGLQLFANPRNAATGGLRTKDAKETSARGIEAFIYQLGYAVDKNGKNLLDGFNNHNESIQYLGTLGFKIPDKAHKVCNNISEVISFCKEWQELRDTYEYEIDGLVVKVNSLSLQRECGYTSHHPRWAIAFKFKAKQATTKMINIEYQVGKIGAITPVAKLHPVQLAGVTVSSVSLHNEDFIVTKDLRLGDTVLVERAGDVIPYIVKSMDEIRTGTEQKIIFPTNCPSCNSKLIRKETEAAWFCTNTECPAQIVQKLIHHVSKVAMDIDGFGASMIERFYDLGIINKIADIYNLDYNKISTLEGLGARSVENLTNAIEKAKNNPISRLLHSLSIHHLGKKASKILAGKVHNVLDLKNWTVEAFTEIKDVGPVVANNVVAYFQDPQNISELERMESYGVNLKQTQDDVEPVSSAEGPFIGKTILFTGALMHYTREEAEKIAAQNGATVMSAVSSKLNILVVGEKAGSKLKKATDLGTVEVIAEDDFKKIIENYQP
jgi:DNA ligase (NAD+)